MGLFTSIIAILGLGIPLGSWLLIRNKDKELKKEMELTKREYDISKKEIQIINDESKKLLAEIRENKNISDNLVQQSNNENLTPKQKQDLQNEAEAIKQDNFSTPFQRAIAEAVELYLAKKYQESINKYNAILELFSKDIRLNQVESIYFQMGVSYYKLREYQKAINCLDKAIDINPKNDNAWYNKGIVYTELKEYQKAIECYDKATDMNPKNAKAIHKKKSTLKLLAKKKNAKNETKKKNTRKPK